MKIAVVIVRVLMGAMFLMASIMFFMKTPHPEPTGDMKTYMDGIMTVQMIPMVKVLELVCGLLFVIGRYVALTAVVIFPIIINIVLFHGFLQPEGILIPLLLLLGDFFLFYAYRKHYTNVFAARRIE